MKRSVVKLIAVVAVLLGVAISLRWKEYGACAIPVVMGSVALSAFLSFMIIKWIDR